MKKKTKFILVAASMSAGKSSLINALIGKIYLPAGNEATTAKVARITVGTKTKPNAQAYSHSGSIVATSSTFALNKFEHGTYQMTSQLLMLSFLIRGAN